jgi:hypothetical protein
MEMASSRSWEAMTPFERGFFQIRQDRLSMDVSAMKEGLSALLGRPVWTHELADPDQLWNEFLGISDRPTFDQILAKLPERFREGSGLIIVSTTNEGQKQ